MCLCVCVWVCGRVGGSPLAENTLRLCPPAGPAGSPAQEALRRKPSGSVPEPADILSTCVVDETRAIRPSLTATLGWLPLSAPVVIFCPARRCTAALVLKPLPRQDSAALAAEEAVQKDAEAQAEGEEAARVAAAAAAEAAAEVAATAQEEEESSSDEVHHLASQRGEGRPAPRAD